MTVIDKKSECKFIQNLVPTRSVKVGTPDTITEIFDLQISKSNRKKPNDRQSHLLSASVHEIAELGNLRTFLAILKLKST